MTTRCRQWINSNTLFDKKKMSVEKMFDSRRECSIHWTRHCSHPLRCIVSLPRLGLKRFAFDFWDDNEKTRQWTVRVIISSNYLSAKFGEHVGAVREAMSTSFWLLLLHLHGRPCTVAIQPPASHSEQTIIISFNFFFFFLNSSVSLGADSISISGHQSSSLILRSAAAPFFLPLGEQTKNASAF